MAESKTTRSRRPARITHDQARIDRLRERGSYLSVTAGEDEQGNPVYKTGSELKFSGRQGMWAGRMGRAGRPDLVYVESVRLAGEPDVIRGYLEAAGYSQEDIEQLTSEDYVYTREDEGKATPEELARFAGGTITTAGGAASPEEEILSLAQILIPQRYQATESGAGAGVRSPRAGQNLLQRVRSGANLIVTNIDEEGKGVTTRSILPTGTRTQLRAHPELPNVYSATEEGYRRAMSFLADLDPENQSLYERLADEWRAQGLSPAQITGQSASPRAPARGAGIRSQVTRPATVRRTTAGPPTEAKRAPAPSSVPQPQPALRGGRGGRGGRTFSLRPTGSGAGSPGRR